MASRVEHSAELDRFREVDLGGEDALGVPQRTGDDLPVRFQITVLPGSIQSPSPAASFEA